MKVWIVSPCFFDTASFLRVRDEAKQSLISELPGTELTFVLIDDSAGQDRAVKDVAELEDIRVVRPPYNLGHQGALVFALREMGGVVKEDDLIVTMDADGEDRPQDLGDLIAPLLRNRHNLQKVSIARRTRRSETVLFKVLYSCFKAVFRTLTGTVVRNGNFAAYRGWLLHEVIFHPHFDQCYSASFISLPMQIEMVPLPRGERYGGKSRMGYTNLITHGIRMLMPFSERIATRGMVASAILLCVCAVGLLGSLIVGWPVVVPILGLTCGTLTLGIFVLLFATFSQSKSHTLRRLSEFHNSR